MKGWVKAKTGFHLSQKLKKVKKKGLDFMNFVNNFNYRETRKITKHIIGQLITP